MAGLASVSSGLRSIAGDRDTAVSLIDATARSLGLSTAAFESALL
jgi:hypothetical protein